MGERNSAPLFFMLDIQTLNKDISYISVLIDKLALASSLENDLYTKARLKAAMQDLRGALKWLTKITGGK